MGGVGFEELMNSGKVYKMFGLKKYLAILAAITASILLLPCLALAYSTKDLDGTWEVQFSGSNSQWRVTFDPSGAVVGFVHNRYETHWFSGQFEVEEDGRVSGSIHREQTDDTYRWFTAYDSIGGTSSTSNEMNLTINVRWAYAGGFWNYETYSSVWNKVGAEPGPEPGPIPEYTNSIGMKFSLIPAGSFMMGSNSGERREKPVHQVKITRPFYIGIHEVTIKQFLEYMNATGSTIGVDLLDDDCPVEEAGNGYRMKSGEGRSWGNEDQPMGEVSWDGAQAFIGWLISQEGEENYRLPTEAEWEYACRAGSASRWFFGDEPHFMNDYAWSRHNSGGKTHPVGQKIPNAWGLYDMHGNVGEWCQDWHDETYYGHSPGKDPQGPPSSDTRVVRGGRCTSWGYWIRSAYRGYYHPDITRFFVGFRLVRTP